MCDCESVLCGNGICPVLNDWICRSKCYAARVAAHRMHARTPDGPCLGGPATALDLAAWWSRGGGGSSSLSALSALSSEAACLPLQLFTGLFPIKYPQLVSSTSWHPLNHLRSWPGQATQMPFASSSEIRSSQTAKLLRLSVAVVVPLQICIASFLLCLHTTLLCLGWDLTSHLIPHRPALQDALRVVLNKIADYDVLYT